MNLFKTFVFCVVTFAIQSTALAESWINLHTSRFEIIISEKYKDQGHHIAKLSERALDQLSKVYSELPKNKILLVVDHRTNASNGSASHFPYPHIIIYPALPTAYSSIGEYNEWVYELILHELVHFLTFYPNHGVYRPIQWIFGNLFAPNFILLPSWFHEGLAVSLETHLTSGGRMRSENYKEMYKVLANKLPTSQETLSSINERYIPSFPYGQRPYFYGALVVTESTKHNHPENLDKTIQGFSRAIPPYNIYSSAKKNLKQSFKKSRKTVQGYEIDPSLLKKYQKDFIYFGHSPQWLDDTHFIAVKTNKDLFDEFVLYDVDAKKSSKGKLIKRTLGTTRIALSKDKKRIIYDQVVPYKRIYNVTDLYALDLETKKSKRLTYGAQLREASLAQSSDNIVAVQTNLAKTQLVEINPETPKQITVLYAPKDVETRLSSPNYYENDSKIIFIEKKNKQNSQVKILDLVSKSTQTLDFSNSFSKIFWIESHDERLLLHAKEKGKPRQHYVLNSNFSPQQITFDNIGTRSAALRKNKLLVSHISPDNYVTAYYKDFQRQTQTPLEDIKISLAENFILNEPETKSLSIQDKKYSFLDYMVPKYWFPFITPNYGGFANQLLYSISTGSSDPLGINSYSINLRQDTISDRLSGGFNYFHVNQNVVWGLSVNQIESPLTEELSRTFQALGVSARFDLGHERGRGHAFTLGLTHIDAKLEDLQQIKTFGPTLTHSYNSLRHEASRVAPSRGLFSNLSYSHYINQGDYLSYNFLEGYFETYFSKYVVPSQTSLKLFSKALFSDEFLPTVYTPVNYSGYFTTSRQQNNFVIRGYPSGIFQAREAAYTLGVEYYFPLLNIFKGPESLPLFFRRIYGAVVADMGSFKGRIFDGVNTFVDHDMDEIYYGAGVELHAEITIGHYIPVQLSLGIYNALKELEGIEPTQVFVNFMTPVF